MIQAGLPPEIQRWALQGFPLGSAFPALASSQWEPAAGRRRGSFAQDGVFLRLRHQLCSSMLSVDLPLELRPWPHKHSYRTGLLLCSVLLSYRSWLQCYRVLSSYRHGVRHEVMTLSYCHVAGEYPLNLALLPELVRGWLTMGRSGRTRSRRRTTRRAATTQSPWATCWTTGGCQCPSHP